MCEKETAGKAYIVLVRALQVNDCVEELSKQRKDTIVLVQRLQAGEEADEQLELLPLASVQCLLCAASNTLHGLNGDLRLDLVAVECDGCDERDLERLLEDAMFCQQSGPRRKETWQSYSCTQML
jgi:hypothetical protein